MRIKEKANMINIIVNNVNIPSGQHQLKGRIYIPNKKGNHPAAVICHGYPGNTKNMDLAEELAFNGYVSLIFFYRGAWGSTGDWSFTNLDPSTRDALSYLREQPYVNLERIGLISHSMGALPLTKRLSIDDNLKTGVLMSPAADLSSWNIDETIDTMIPRLLLRAEGKLQGLTEEGLRKDMKKACETLNPMDNIIKINKPLMIIVGTDDQRTPPETCKRLFEKANEPKKYVEVDGADHVYNDYRYPLMNHVLCWLDKHL